MNYMIHNLTAEATKVSITYDIDFVPDGIGHGAEDHPGPAALDGRGRPKRLPGLRRA